jgi:tetratricopeptide (TPR) repeat protein
MACCPALPIGNARIVASDPGESAPDEHGFLFFSTACWRRYIGTWEIKDGQLYLAGIRGIYKLLGQEPLFADWFTGVLRVPRGKILHYVHGDFLSVYEEEVRVNIENGVVVKTRVIDNRPPLGPAARHYKKGRAWRRKGEYKKSIAAFSESVRLRPEYADAYYARGLSYESLGDFDRSLADFQTALQLEPGAIYVTRMSESVDEEVFCPWSWETARGNIDGAIARVLACRGMVFLQKGEYERAAADFTKSIELDPKPCVRFARGKAYFALRRFKEAIDDLMAFGLTNPKEERVRFDIYYRLANCYREMRFYKQAIFNAGIAIRLDPNSPEAYFVRGCAYLDKSEPNKAIVDFTEAIRLHAEWADAYVERAKAYQALGNEIRAAEDSTNAEQA